MNLNKLLLIGVIIYILATQYIISGYVKMNNSLQASLTNMIAVCSESDTSDLNKNYLTF